MSLQVRRSINGNLTYKNTNKIGFRIITKLRHWLSLQRVHLSCQGFDLNAGVLKRNFKMAKNWDNLLGTLLLVWIIKVELETSTKMKNIRSSCYNIFQATRTTFFFQRQSAIYHLLPFIKSRKKERP